MIRLTIGLGTAVMILTLLCTVACGGGGDGSLAKGGINMIVVSGQATIQSGGGNTLVVEGQEAVLTAGDQITADGAGAKLLLVDGSLLDLKPDTDLQIITFSAEGTAKLRQLKGSLEVQAASPLLTIEVSTFGSDEGSAFKTMRFTATPTVRETAFGLEIDGLKAQLTVEAGGVNVTHDDGTETVSAGGEVKATPEELIVSQTGAIAGLTATATPTATHLSQPSPTVTATPTPLDFLYPAPGLIGPPDGSDFKPDETILLIWATPAPLSGNEWYEVQLRRDGDVSYTVVRRVKEGTWKVESRYNPGRYQWRIVVVRGQEEGPKEIELSPPSQTWSFGWLSPTPGPTPIAPTSPPVSGASSPSLTIYLLGTNNSEGFATFPGERHVDAGMIYTEGRYVYGNVAVRIGDTVYHPGEESSPEQLPDPWRVDFEFDQLLVERTGNEASFDPKKAQFWVGTLDGDSAVGGDSPYSLTMNLYEGNKLRKSIQVFFTVADAPESPGGGGEDIVIPPTRQPS
jgi:hypothetical protein